MITTLVLLLAAAAPGQTTCTYDRATLKLGIDAFDQDLNGGWRTLEAKPGCTAKAAEMLRYYRERIQSGIRSLYWHEGQLRAELGEIEEAIGLLSQNRHASDEDGWNDYADATIAFLRNDRSALLAARDRLAHRPPPTGRRYVDRDGAPVAAPPWPENLDVIDRLITCFGRPYREAYSCGLSKVDAKSG